MSLTVGAVSSPSPLSNLNRATRQRRQSPYLTSTTSRRNSPLSLATREPSARATMNTVDSIDDSDDDESKAPQLSALARMLLDDFSEVDPVVERLSEPASSANPDQNVRKRLSWSQSPGDQYQTGSSGTTSTARTSSSPLENSRELVTPAPGRHPRRAFNGSFTTMGSSDPNFADMSAVEANKETEHRYTASNYGSVMRPSVTSTSIGGLPSTSASAIRWKRAGRGILGGLAGPARRGPRRDSDQQEDREDNEGDVIMEHGEPRNNTKDEVKEQGEAVSRHAPTPKEDYAEQSALSTISRRSRRSSPESFSAQQPRLMAAYSGLNTPEEHNSSSEGNEVQERMASDTFLSRAAAVAAAPPPPPPPPAPLVVQNEKENMPPPAFRRPMVSTSTYKRMGPPEEKSIPAPISPSRAPIQRSFVPSPPAHVSPEKKNILLMKSNNTPLRPAPPPPKMSMLETVTASAGALATSSSRQRRSAVHVNGKPYKRLDAIGKGGSCKVYKVMAENYKILAMKKVVFNSQDGESAIRGYKGEIELLRKLAGNDRVIRLFDWEINDEKQCLTMLMECGETDLAKVLTLRHSNDDSQMDVSFIRYYWREMLACVDAVHALNIIHSDLKPANFLLVAGRLKLIDFGIANAIQDDTVNVHRESQVGTLNYMSPEAIVDINASSGKPMASVGAPRLMKLGAPSDVWSLGCILYQMTYGKTPFYHLTSMFQKINAIPDATYPIDYPSTGIGGVSVPRSLINTIKGCLERDKNLRPTIRQLLADDDLFLNPDKQKEEVVDVTMEMLKMLLENAVDHVAEKGVPNRDVTAAWAKDVFEKLERRMSGKPRSGGSNGGGGR